jgi:peroxiredoxin
MLPIGTKAPDFQLPDVSSNEIISLKSFTDKAALLVIFLCQHCPFVKHVKQELAKIGEDYANSGLGIVAISSNDVKNYPDDSPEKLKAMAQELNLTFPICYDETQKVAQSYTAACTPDFFLFDALSARLRQRHFQLAYRGQLDDSRPGNNIPVTGVDLRAAIASVLAGEAITTPQKPSIGCNIKWKAGNEPPYFG